MRILITDQRSEPTCNRNFRAELFDDHNIPAGVGYGMTEAEAIGDAWECLLDALECEARLALAVAL